MACTKDEKKDINKVIIEESVTDSSIETDLVCAVGAQITLSAATQKKPLQLDKTRYWCNFCCFKTDTQEGLLQHVMEHRFHCKYCDFQSFSRATVIQHSALEHQHFIETASSLRFCIFLPDTLRRNSLKKRETENTDGQGSAKKLRMEMKEFKTHLKREVMNLDEKENTEFARAVDSTAHAESVSSLSMKAPSANCFQKPINQDHVEMTLRPSSSETEVLSVITNAICGQEKRTAARGTSSSHKPTCEAKSMEKAETQLAATPNAEGNMRSSLCWNCGYCGFVTLIQPLLELHQTSSHQGQRHKYLANLVSSHKEIEIINASDLQFSKRHIEDEYANHHLHFIKTNVATYSSVTTGYEQTNIKANVKFNVFQREKNVIDGSNEIMVPLHAKGIEQGEQTITKAYNSVAPSKNALTKKCLPYSNNDNNVEITPRNSRRNKRVQKGSAVQKEMAVITNVIGDQGAITAVGGTNSSHKPTHKAKSMEEAETQFSAIPNEGSRTSEGNMRSSLCWNCGYCGFVTLVQPLLELHQTSSHQGQRHKYLANLVSSQKEIEIIKASDLQLSKRQIEDENTNKYL